MAAVANIICFITVPWGYELMITCIESMVCIIVLTILTIVELRISMRTKDTPYFKI